MKALFFDLDDTLLNSDHIVSERNRNAIIRCKELGMLIGYITVRSPRKMKLFLDRLPCDCIANYNGAMIYADGNLLAKNCIPYYDAMTFIKQVLKESPHINMSCYFEPYCYRENKLINTITNEILSDSILNSPKLDYQRIRIVLNQYDKIDLIQYTTKTMRYHVTSKSSIITSIGATKENALKLLMKHYNITPKNVISFGDDINDIDMLKASGTGVAMGNALQDVKNVADYVTLTNNEDGVAEYIEKFIL